VRIVLITLDTLRFDYFDAGPDGKPAMPLTLAHARRGLIFERFYTSSPVTQPSHATLFTGLQPWEHGITRNGLVLSDRFPSIVEIFREHGFETQAVIASFPLASRFGFARGFDKFYEDFGEMFMKGLDVWEGDWEIPGGEFFSMGDSITEQAMKALNQAKADRQFFWFHYFDPHSPYGSSQGQSINKFDIFKETFQHSPPGGPMVKKYVARAKRLYAKDVAYMDAALAHLLNRLETDSGRFETHIFVVSDHGESFGEGGSLAHGFRLSEEQIRVPAFNALAEGLRRCAAPGSRGDRRSPNPLVAGRDPG
jgi:arylsulfatase A-like enzyme